MARHEHIEIRIEKSKYQTLLFLGNGYICLPFGIDVYICMGSTLGPKNRCYGSIIANNSLEFDEVVVAAHLERVYIGAIFALQEETK